jgi:hypothetical protein
LRREISAIIAVRRLRGIEVEKANRRWLFAMIVQKCNGRCTFELSTMWNEKIYQ